MFIPSIWGNLPEFLLDPKMDVYIAIM